MSCDWLAVVAITAGTLCTAPPWAVVRVLSTTLRLENAAGAQALSPVRHASLTELDARALVSRALVLSLPLADVVTFEPVAQFRAVIAAGLSRNAPSFARRVSVHPHLVYDHPGEYTLRVPVPVPGSLFKRLLGMSGLVDGTFGLVKGVVDVRLLPRPYLHPTLTEPGL